LNSDGQAEDDPVDAVDGSRSANAFEGLPSEQLDEFPCQERGDKHGQDVECHASEFGGPAILPVGREQRGSIACTVGDHMVEIRAEVGSVCDLEGSPRRCHHMGDEGGQNMGDRLIKNRDNGHAENPELKCDENKILSLCIVEDRYGPVESPDATRVQSRGCVLESHSADVDLRLTTLLES